MELKLLEGGAIMIRGARVLGGQFRNFKGGPDKFNKAGGRRYFHISMEDDIAQALNENNWRVKILPPKEEGDDSLNIMKVNINFGGFRPPKIYGVTNGKSVRYDEEMTDELDYSDILFVDLVLNPYEAQDGINSAYLEEGRFNIRAEYFASEYDEEVPFE